ncbi:carboxypeptidase N subunit 2-like [Montipora capricornis]|uniref:carboxypeptidase N subunit 2-like n=1 Tax=Montipora capricornis TaxID=246305 RepID=UPI0035F2199D
MTMETMKDLMFFSLASTTRGIYSTIEEMTSQQLNKCLRKIYLSKTLSKRGDVAPTAHKQALTKEVIEKLYDDGELVEFDTLNPGKLQQTTRSFISLFLGKRGKETQHTMKKTMLALRKTPAGEEYYEVSNKDLSGNQLKDLPDSIFDKNAQLSYLDLSKNLLTDLLHGIFDKNAKLSILELSGNQLKDLPDGIFDKNAQLSNLELSGNQLKDLPDGIFDKNAQLSNLDLSGNQLKDLPDGIFDKNAQLSYLYLRDIQLSKLPGGVFDNNTQLATLIKVGGHFVMSVVKCHESHYVGVLDNPLKNMSILGRCLRA